MMMSVFTQFGRSKELTGAFDQSFHNINNINDAVISPVPNQIVDEDTPFTHQTLLRQIPMVTLLVHGSALPNWISVSPSGLILGDSNDSMSIRYQLYQYSELLMEPVENIGSVFEDGQQHQWRTLFFYSWLSSRVKSWGLIFNLNPMDDDKDSGDITAISGVDLPLGADLNISLIEVLSMEANCAPNESDVGVHDITLRNW